MDCFCNANYVIHIPSNMFFYATARCIVWSSDSLSQTLVESEGPATLTLQLQNTDGTQPEPLGYPLDLQVRYIPITAEGML